MYDIAITNQGTPDLSSGDLRLVDYQTFILQKLYRVIMRMPANLAVGTGIIARSTLTQVVRQYINNELASDADIDPSSLVIESSDTAGMSAVSFVIRYRLSTEFNDAVDPMVDFTYKHGEGAILSIDTVPEWLSLPDYSGMESVTEYVRVTETTNMIEVSRRPVMASDIDGGLYPIYLLSGSMNPDVARTEPFSITVSEGRKTYAVSRYCSFAFGAECITGISVSTSDVSYETKLVDGEYVIIAYSAGTITGSATIVNALQVSFRYESEAFSDLDLPYPQREVQGRYMVVFPKTVKPGGYTIRYTTYI